MRNLSSGAKWVLGLFVGVPVLGYACQRGIALAPPGTPALGAVVLLPIIGFGLLFWKFAKWHRSFHRRMTEKGN
jgi:hypothetical protein